MKTYRQFLNEYFTWNDEMTEKTIDLGELYKLQEGNMYHIAQTLRYEFRDFPNRNLDEYKEITLNSLYRPNLYWVIKDNEFDYDKNGIIFSEPYKNNRLRINGDSFHNFFFKIKTIKKNYTEQNPYGEENWANEAYYTDMSPYDYSFEIPECVNIGWLDENHPFEKGETPSEFVEKLKKNADVRPNMRISRLPFLRETNKGNQREQR
jgi:hypothetical protein